VSLEVACLGYAAFANLARASHRHRNIRAAGTMPTQQAARIAGWALLALSCAIAFLRFGPFQGMVAWLGMLSLGGVALVLALSRWPDRALQAWLPVLVLAAVFALV
jgi:hypothetical protein